jgi:Smr domain
MSATFTIGQGVHTPLGKGIVRATRRQGRILVELNGRAVEFDGHVLEPVDKPGTSGRKARARTPPVTTATSDRPDHVATADRRARAEVDLHGLTVAEALDRSDQAVNDAALADLPELRLIHGRSGGRIRAALHRHLHGMTAVRAFHLDPANAGVTVVRL